MKYLALIAVAAGLAFGQYLETTIDFTPGSEPGTPTAIVWNSTDNRLYVSDWYDRNLAVIDGATNDKLAPIAAANRVVALCYNPGQNRVYAPSENSDTLAIINGATGAVTFIHAGGSMTDLCYNPVNGRVHTVNKTDASVSVLREGEPGAVSEQPGNGPPASAGAPAVVRSDSVLGAADSRQNTGHRAELRDVTGRKALDLRPSANDVSRLATGVYFVREGPQAVRKFIVTR